jgi:4-alpha-glucanotransferase
MDDFAVRASEWGIERVFIDALGHRREVGHEALERLLNALTGGRDFPPTQTIIWRGDNRAPVVVPDEARHWRLRAERGDIVAEGECPPHDITSSLPALPFGAYDLECRREDETPIDPSAHLIVAPAQTFQPDAARSDRVWILAVQLYAVRSRRNWGHGDFTDLRALLKIAARAGASGIGLNPLHALFDDRAEEASPYSPNSRLFLNPLYIDVDAVPDFPGSEAAGLAERIEAARRSDIVRYADVAAAKSEALRLAYARFRKKASAQRRKDFEAFRREQGFALQAFAAFEVLRRRFKTVWWEWPEPYRRASANLIDEVRAEAAEDVGYYEYVQWLADRQLGACRDEARRLALPIGLYTDLAVGADPGGADAWGDQGAVVPQIEVGAPPDALNTAGQAWGLAAFNPRALIAESFAPFRRVLRAAMRYAGAVRLDHVLGLNRLYLIPLGFKAAEGAYIRYPLQELLAVTALESLRNNCVVIGEDLGTVPDELRAALADWGIWSYLVLMFERGHDGGFREPRHYRREALVTFSTHDLPSFSGWIVGHDLNIKRGLGIDPGESDDARHYAWSTLRGALERNGIDPGHGSLRLLDVLRFLARTPSRLLAVSIDDVLDVIDQPNVPGTVLEHPNWRRRLPLDLEEFDNLPAFHALAAMLRDEGRGAAPATSSGASE